MTYEPSKQVTWIELVNDTPEETAQPRCFRANFMVTKEVDNWLDTMASTMRVSRSEILRGVCAAFCDQKVQFTGCHSEFHIKNVIGRLLAAGARLSANPPAPRPPQKASLAPSQTVIPATPRTTMSTARPLNPACVDLDETLARYKRP